MVKQIDELKNNIDTFKVEYERATQRKDQIEEEKKDLSENLKKISKQTKKKKEVLTELQKLGG